MPLSVDLADRVLAFKRDLVDDALLSAARIAITDTLGVTLLGAADTATRILADTPGVADAAGPCVVLGTGLRRSSTDAALLNGVASHADDFDDFTQVFGGHPSVPVLPALLALSNTRSVTGAKFVGAYVVGVETETRMAMGVHFQHYEKGWHPTATLGVFGAAAASAWLMGLDGTQTATALCIAASLSSGIKANFGTMTKPLHVGHCTRNGLLAALLAENGFSASLDALDGAQGYLNVFNGPGEYDIPRMLDGWYAPAAVLTPGISIKQFPCCGSTHPAIYAALELRNAHGLNPKNIDEIEIRTHPRRLPHTDNPLPAGALQAKFSIQYCVARALLSGPPALAHFEDKAVADPEVQRLLTRVRVVADTSVVADDHNTFGAVVSVVNRNGKKLESTPVRWAGRGADYPMTEQELREKFFDCARRVLPPARVEALWTMLESLETIADMNTLTDLAAASGPAHRAAAG